MFLFIICIDEIIEKLENQFGTGNVIAYADDILIAVPNNCNSDAMI